MQLYNNFRYWANDYDKNIHYIPIIISIPIK